MPLKCCSLAGWLGERQADRLYDFIGIPYGVWVWVGKGKRYVRTIFLPHVMHFPTLHFTMASSSALYLAFAAMFV